MKFKIIQLLLLVFLFILVIYESYDLRKRIDAKSTIEYYYYPIEVTSLELNKTNLQFLLNYYNVKHPQIVYNQALLETGNFTSSICKNYNNIFGLYNSKTKEFYKFNHWSESILAYKKYIQYKYIPNNCYYTFLKELPYAEDSLYINKLKYIQNGK